MKTAEQIAQDAMDKHIARGLPLYGPHVQMSTEAIFTILTGAIEADREQLVGDVQSARMAINATEDAAEGDSNDAEIEVLQDVRDAYRKIVAAVGGNWEYEPGGDDGED